MPPAHRFVANCTYLDAEQKASLYTPALRDEVSAFDPYACHWASFERVHDADFLNQMLYLDTKIFMPSLNLNYNDKMSMASSVEVRVPFLDHEFAEFVAWNVPPSLKLGGLFRSTTKYIFREAMQDILPEEVLNQPKAGFGAPVDYWLTHDLKEMVDDLLSEARIRQRGLFRHEAVCAYINEHRCGKQDWSMQIWQFLTLELWMQNFIDGGGRLRSRSGSTFRGWRSREASATAQLMLILGLNMFHADASAALVQDGKIIFAVAEERLNRIKHYAGFPSLAIKACLDFAGVKIADVDHVAVGQDSDANLAKKVQYAVANPARILNFIRLRQRKQPMRDVRSLLARALDVDPNPLRFQEHHVEHHIAHIASAYYCSPFDKAAGFSYDGSGDFVSTMMAGCEGNRIEVLDRVFLPDSLGSFYTMICEFIGYQQYGDEGKVMGLAPYGKDTLCGRLAEVIGLQNGSFHLDRTFFKPLGSNQGMQVLRDGTVQLACHFSNRMVKAFGDPREPHSEITQREMDLAYAAQCRFEDVLFHLLNQLYRRTPCEDLAMAGGCALNSAANGKLFARTPFRRTWIQPAAGDEGLAIGAALYTYHAVLNQPRRFVMKNSYLGHEFSDARIESDLKKAGLRYRKLEPEPLLNEVAQQIAAGNVVGWFQGRMEWGPRALGTRSDTGSSRVCPE